MSCIPAAPVVILGMHPFKRDPIGRFARHASSAATASLPERAESPAHALVTMVDRTSVTAPQITAALPYLDSADAAARFEAIERAVWRADRYGEMGIDAAYGEDLNPESLNPGDPDIQELFTYPEFLTYEDGDRPGEFDNEGPDWNRIAEAMVDRWNARAIDIAEKAIMDNSIAMNSQVTAA